MPAKKHSSVDRVLGRLEALDPASLSSLVQRLARERGLFERIFNALQEGVLVVTAAGAIEYSNDAARRMVGLDGEDPAGRTLWRLVPGLRDSLARDLDDDTGPPRGPAVVREFDLTYPEARTVRAYIVPFEEEEDRPGRRLAVILTDVTHDKRTTGKRIEDERTSSVLLLAAGVAHELGNPLNSLTIHLQLMERKLKKLGKVADAEGIGESVRVCRDEVQRLDGIIRHFLEAIRPRQPDLAETSLSEVLAEVLRFQQREFANRGIVVEAETPLTLPTVMADRDQLKQVFFNITRNAIDAMQPGGRLKIRSRADDESVYLLFGDSGSGIKATDLARLFQPYFTTKASGHGLGLMIVQRIMRDHGGRAEIESKEGVGTIVTLQFPRKDRRVRLLEG
jgi:PAS domain S-box-containing protein